MPARQAYADLQAIRHRLPQQPTQSPTALCADGVLALAQDYDHFWFDAFGVLNVGNSAIAGAIEAIAALRALGKKVLVVSNASAMSKAHLHQRMLGLGFDFSAREIVSSRDAMLASLPQDAAQPFGLIGFSHNQEDLPPAHYLHQDEPNFWQDSASFLFLSSYFWDEEKQKRFVAELERQPRPVHVANPDLIAPQGDNTSIEPGTYTLTLPEALFPLVTVYGKPFPTIFQIAAERTRELGSPFNPSRTLMLGDTLHTDILGANAFGIQSALVTAHGFLKGLEIDWHIQDSGIVPTHIIPSL